MPGFPEVGIPVVDLGSLSGRDLASESGPVADPVEAFSGIGFSFITGHDGCPNTPGPPWWKV